MSVERFKSHVAVVLSGLMLVFSARTATQTISAVTEAQAREWAAYAVGKAAGDPKIFDSTFMSLARIAARSYRADPFSLGLTVYRSDALVISAVGPVSFFQLETSEAIRKLLPASIIGKIPWPCGVSVSVRPSQIDSPDIERIVVRRGGQIIEPIVNELVATPMTTKLGVKVTKHSGRVCYAQSTFALGAEVIVIGIPVAGSNITKTLTEGELGLVI